ncbi:MAG TPA: tetratricopeptide repeat protein, partial [Gemmatimonadaceae bacterium]|nr:tetratricopeptide repeat protein [Gemmatimonadaceae bacterium]
WYRTADLRRASDVASARRVLVVPFENATGDPALAPLGRMAADWVAQGLAMTGVVEVAGAPTLGAAGNEVELKTAAAEVGAGTVVSGTYYTEGDSVRVQARVTNVAEWKVARAVAPVSAAKAAPSKLLEPLRQRVMAVLAVDHDPRYAALNTGAPPPTYDAYDQFLAGIDVFERGDFAGSIPYFTRAAALDSSYVQPLVRAADTYLILGRLAEADTLVRLLERSRQALTPADRAGVARLRGILDGDRMAELAGARAVAAAAPGAQLPYFQHALSAAAAARPAEALMAIVRAPEFGRTRPVLVAGTYWSVITTAHHMLGDYKAELQAANEARRYHPESREILGDELRALAALGRLDDLTPRLDQLEVMAPPERRSSVPALLTSLAEELDAHGHVEEARRVLRRAVAWQRARSAQERQIPRARAELARALYVLGEYDTAQPLFEALAAETPADPRYVLQLGLIEARRQRRAEAQQIGERLRALKGPYDHGRTTYALAQLAAVLGDRDGAMALLNQALAEGVEYGQSLHADPDLASLRGDPRFRELLRPKG